ncbi:MAG: formate dehydrogenase subunit delta [Alphaproteobacteria bacterium]
MDAQRLVYMANQIANYFKAYPAQEAVDATENHLRQFWDPRMRTQLSACLDEGGGAGKELSAIARAAALRLRAEKAAGAPGA